MKIFGEIGVLVENDEKVQCHICGKWYVILGVHVVKTHGMSCDDYKARFGLARSTSLACKAFCDLHRELHGERLTEAARKSGAWTLFKTQTKEQKSELGKMERRESTRQKARMNVLQGINPLLADDVREKCIAAAKTPEALAKRSKSRTKNRKH